MEQRPRISCQTVKKCHKDKPIKSKSPSKCHALVKIFLQRLSAAGIGRISGSSSRWRRVAWCLMVVGTAFLMSYMTYKVIKEYFEYKKTIETTGVILSSMIFPAITICSPITLLRSRASTAGVHHLVKFEEFFQDVRKYENSKADRAQCNENPACSWYWFKDQCNCLLNPCESEYCEKGRPLCVCSALLCSQFNESCFQVKDMKNDNDEVCYCQNGVLSAEKSNNVKNSSKSSDEVLKNLTDPDVRALISIIRNSEVDDLSDVMWAIQPNTYSLANYGTSFDNLILGCSFQKKKCDKRNFTVLYTPSYGKCYTFNYAGEYAKHSNPIETKRFGWNSGLKLDLQIREEELINILTKDIGIIVTVHDPRELPYVSENGMTVRAGDSASLRVQRAQINRLGQPWGKCLYSGAHLPFNYTDQPYSQLGCQRYCQNYFIKQRCNCVRRSLSPVSLKRPTERHKASICNFNVESEKLCSEEVIELIENETIQCNCYQACREDVFYTSLTAGKINKRFYQLVKSAKTLRIEDGEYLTTSASNKSNVLSLRVYYGTLTLQNITERASYSWETLIANIGGNLGFFMGLTLITFLELAELIWDLFLSAFKLK